MPLSSAKQAVEPWRMAKVSEVLSRAVQETEDRLAQHQRFTEIVQQFQRDIFARNEAALAQADSFVARLVGKVDSATGTLLAVFSRSLKTATEETQNLSGNIKVANDELERALTTLEKLHQDTVLRDKERSATQDLALKDNQILASDVQASLENVRDVTVHALAQRLQGVEAAVVHYLNTQQQALEDQQTFQETQSRIMKNQLTIETNLASQHDLIEEQSHKIAEMTFGGLGNTIATYVGLAIFVILLSRASLILAAAAASGIGVVSMIGFAPITSLFSFLSSTHLVITPWALHLVTYATGIATAVALIYIIIISGSLLRSFMISRIGSSTMLEIEVKREPTPYADDALYGNTMRCNV
ncbi:hypothetical protein SLS55_002918 [Diplodia seriata]|uniref:Uncharacterized protein n=1 Tax=Diplodia seriata TaxID=420778 RepID=A0ABR3CLI0_9PEZI